MDDGSEMTCNEYIGKFDSLPTLEECTVDFHFLYTVRNIGTLCGLVNQVTSIVDKDSTLIDSVEGDLIAPGDEVDFCPTQEMPLKHDLVGVNICHLADNTVPLALEGFDVKVDLTDIDFELDDLNLDLDLELPAFPQKQCTDAEDTAFEFTFQIEERLCNDSDNSQWTDFRKDRLRRLSKKRKKGKGSSAKTNDCNQNSALLPSEPWVEILSTDGKEDFSESVSYGSSIIISTDDRTIEDLHVKVKSRMGGQVVQEFFFDTTKMCTGDIFGILSVSGIKFK